MLQGIETVEAFLILKKQLMIGGNLKLINKFDSLSKGSYSIVNSLIG